MHQSFILSINSTIRINFCVVKTFQFFHQFCLIVQQKPEKEYIIPNTFSRLASVNNPGHNALYSELDMLFVYYTILIKINFDLIIHILESYIADY